MFPQEHNSLIDSGLEQMLQHFPYAPLPVNPTPMIDRSITSSTRWKPNIEVAPNCPRCASTNTKFCYYNNYSLSQPRYFCKGCRRYWTKGGSLRNVPIGGGCRKNRRGKTARQSQSERSSMMNNGNNSDDRESSAGGDGDQIGNETNNGSRDIDMALVFAKFLNQKPSSNEEYGSSSSNNLSNSLTTPESGENIEKDVVVQPQKKGCEFDGDDDPLGLLGGVHVEGTMENFIDELEGFDDVWCDDDAVTCWQPPPPPPPPPMTMQMQLQELEEYSVAPLLNEEDGMLPIISSSNNYSMDLISDGWSTNWGSFDLSTMEVFSSSSRP